MAKPSIKCGHCHRLIEDDDVVVVFDDGSLIHVRCWRVNESELMRESSDLVRHFRRK